MTPNDIAPLVAYFCAVGAALVVGYVIGFARGLRQMLPQARGRALDALAMVHGYERKRWWIFRESDRALRRRVTDAVRSRTP